MEIVKIKEKIGVKLGFPHDVIFSKKSQVTNTMVKYELNGFFWGFSAIFFGS